LSKLPVFEWFFNQGDVLITVNTHVDQVDIPPNLRNQEIVDFILGPTPTPKMTMDERGVTASMRFSGALYACYFPWTAIIQMSGQDAVIQFRNPLQAGEKSRGALDEETSQGKKRANLRLVK